MIRIQPPARPLESVPVKLLAPQPDRRWLAWWEYKPAYLALDVALVAGLAWFAATVPASTTGHIVVFCLVMPVLLVRRRFPWLPVLATPLVFVAPAEMLPTVVACYTASRQWGPRWRTLASFILAAGSLTIAAWDPKPNDGVFYQLVVPPVWLAASMVLGLWMHQRRTLLDALRGRAAQAERNSELLSEQAVAAERRRIAREMHDVVAHRVSTIALQAGALTLTAPDERTAETAEVIRSASATALTELREILDVLRKDEQDLQDQPERIGDLTGVQADGSIHADVEALVEDSVAAGATITLDAPADLPEVPGPIRRAAYRVVQESLTNAAKHAPHAPVDISLGTGPGELRLTITNHRGERSGAIPGSGYGLLGMRERVSLARGTLRTGPTDDGGFQVHAAFPLSPSRSRELM